MARPTKNEELEALKRQHADTAKRIAELQKKEDARLATEAKLRSELVGAAVLAHYQGAELAALLRDIVLPRIKNGSERRLFMNYLPAGEIPPAPRRSVITTQQYADMVSGKKADKPAAAEKVQAAE